MAQPLCCGGIGGGRQMKRWERHACRGGWRDCGGWRDQPVRAM